MIEKFTMRNPIIDKIIDLVCEDFYAEKEAIISKSRKRELVVVRQAIMTICKDFTHVSLANIGRHFGGRDHSTVIHALNSTSDLIETDRVFKQKMIDVKTRVAISLGGEKKESEDEEFYSEMLYCENWEMRF
jgi:chromosomal replication initiator protein